MSAVIVSACRTPIAKMMGGLSSLVTISREMMMIYTFTEFYLKSTFSTLYLEKRKNYIAVEHQMQIHVL